MVRDVNRAQHQPGKRADTECDAYVVAALIPDANPQDAIRQQEPNVG